MDERNKSQTPEAPGVAYVRYLFLKIDPQWRRLPKAEKDKGIGQVLALVDECSDQVDIHSYSLMATRGDVDILLWQISPCLEALGELAARLFSTGFGRYLSSPHAYLSITRPSPYTNRHSHPGEAPRRGGIKPRGDPYLFVYPFVKTHDWYQLSSEERQRIMDEHFAVGHRYPQVKIHTTYSFGIDDQEFVLGFETTDPQDFVRLVMELRESLARPYTLRDTPAFTCIRVPLSDCLASFY